MYICLYGIQKRYSNGHFLFQHDPKNVLAGGTRYSENILQNSSIKSNIIVALFPTVIFAKNIQGYISSFQKVLRGDSSNFASTFASQVESAVLLFKVSWAFSSQGESTVGQSLGDVARVHSKLIPKQSHACTLALFCSHPPTALCHSRGYHKSFSDISVKVIWPPQTCSVSNSPELVDLL